MSGHENLDFREPEGKCCRKCGHPDVMRIPRRWRDHLVERLSGKPVRRYRCGRCRTELALPG